MSTAKVKLLDDNIVDVPFANLVPNNASAYLAANPGQFRVQCSNANCQRGANCNYVHFVANVAPPEKALSPQTVKVKLLDDNIVDVPFANLVPNNASAYLAANPGQFRVQCNNANCQRGANCNYVHFVANVAPPEKALSPQTVKVKLLDGNIVDVPLANLVPNNASAYLAANPGQFRVQCNNANCQRGANCNYVHFVANVAPPDKANLPAPKPTQYVGVIVDGYCFTKCYGWGNSVFETMLTDIVQTIQAAVPLSKVEVHPHALVFMFPDPLDAMDKGLIRTDKARETIVALRDLSNQGWKPVQSGFKRVGQRWMATAEDTAFCNQAAMLCRQGSLAPIGADPANLSLTHLVLVTGDKDHLSTLQARTHSELRWLASPSPNRVMEDEASSFQRLIKLSMPPLPAEADAPPVQVNAKLKATIEGNPYAVVAATAANPFPSNEKTLHRLTPPLWVRCFSTEAARDLYLTRCSSELRSAVVATRVLLRGTTFAFEGESTVGSESANNCRYGKDCTNFVCQCVHPPQRRPLCTLACEDARCPQLHPTARVDQFAGVSLEVPSNRVRNGAAKQAAFAIPPSQNYLKVCKMFPSCRFGTSCRHIHLVEAVEQSAEEVPDGFILASGELINVRDLVDNEGKARALGSRRGKMCTNTPCRFGLRCTFLHRRFEDAVVAAIADIQSNLAAPQVAPPVATQAITPPVECCICSDSIASSQRFCCSQSHVVCHECLSEYITVTWAGRTFAPGVVPELRCAIPDCSSPPLTATQVAMHASEDAVGTFLTVQQRARDAKTYAEAQKLIQDAMQRHGSQLDAARTEAERELLQRQLRSEMPNALMCPQCKFGPIDIRGCSDLGAHHGQAVGRSRIDNSCPNCKFFSVQQYGWMKWDGVLRKLEQRREVPQVVRQREVLVPQLLRHTVLPQDVRHREVFVPQAVRKVMEVMGCSTEMARAAIAAVQDAPPSEVSVRAIEYLLSQQ